jgi:hypothetical protein
LVTVIVTAFPAVTFEYTALGTVTVALVSLDAVTVTSSSIPSDDCVKFTVRELLRKPVPVSVRVDVIPSKIDPETEFKTARTEETFNQEVPSEYVRTPLSESYLTAPV